MEKPAPKKRGRKPKGGKIVKNEPADMNVNVEKKKYYITFEM